MRVAGARARARGDPIDGERVVADPAPEDDASRFIRHAEAVVAVPASAAVGAAADHIIEMGPGPGAHGGEVVVQGTLDDVLRTATRVTFDRVDTDGCLSTNDTVLLLASGAQGLPALQAILLPFFPLMFFPEGFINGWLMTVLVAFRPHWVYSFADEDYINGK